MNSQRNKEEARICGLMFDFENLCWGISFENLCWGISNGIAECEEELCTWFPKSGHSMIARIHYDQNGPLALIPATTLCTVPSNPLFNEQAEGLT